MKRLISLVLLSFPCLINAQTPKSIASPEDADLTHEQREEVEEREDQRIRRQWDLEEERAQSREEKRRLIDEERAERDDLQTP